MKRQLEYKNLKMFAYFTGDYRYTLKLAKRNSFSLSSNRKKELQDLSIHNYDYKTRLKHNITTLALISTIIALVGCVCMC